jgi:hypothetical protein
MKSKAGARAGMMRRESETIRGVSARQVKGMAAHPSNVARIAATTK